MSDPDDAPELTEALAARLESIEARPDLAAAFIGEEDVAVAIDRRVVERLRAEGPDWPERINALLRKAVGLS